MIDIPRNLPPIVPPLTPGGKKSDEAQEVRRPTPAPRGEGIRQMPDRPDPAAVASRLAFYATEARKRELAFEEIIEREILRTGLKDPQAALEEANNRLQKEIDKELDKIKQNKDLMEEAEAWQSLADLLERELSEEQVQQFLDAVKSGIRGL
jgi:hypothetical protein